MDFTDTIWTSRERDDYGRNVLFGYKGTQAIAVLVTVPKATRHLNPGTHFVNHLASDTPTPDVSWYTSQRAARAAFDAILAAA